MATYDQVERGSPPQKQEEIDHRRGWIGEGDWIKDQMTKIEKVKDLLEDNQAKQESKNSQSCCGDLPFNGFFDEFNEGLIHDWFCFCPLRPRWPMFGAAVTHKAPVTYRVYYDTRLLFEERKPAENELD